MLCVRVCMHANSLAKPVVEKIRSLRLSITDFDTLEIIGRGAFGEVKVQMLPIQPCSCWNTVCCFLDVFLPEDLL